MPRYVIERTLPGAGAMTDEQWQGVAGASNDVLDGMSGEDISWVESYVTGDKLFCVYDAANEDLVREHGKRGDFPVDSVHEVKRMISPATGR